MNTGSITPSAVSFQKIEPTDMQIQTLYDLLSSRQHGISHTALPLFSAHSDFVKQHPYRAWFLVIVSQQAIGSFYVSNENTVGINIVDDAKLDDANNEVVKAIIEYVKHHFEPLAPIKSVRAGRFSINVAPNNSALIKALEHAGASVLQLTYSLGEAD